MPKARMYSSIKKAVKYDKVAILSQSSVLPEEKYVGKVKSSEAKLGKSKGEPLQNSLDLIDYKMNFYKARKDPEFNNPNYMKLKNWIKWVDSRKTTLISIDLEVSEDNNKIPLEIGLSIIDFKNQEKSQFPNFLNLHFIIAEHLACTNRKYVPDNKLKYIAGTSYVVSRDEFPSILERIFDHYGLSNVAKSGPYNSKNPPAVALVGHNFSSDSTFLQKCFNIDIHPKVPILDTLTVWNLTFDKIHRKKSKLSYILLRLNVPALYLHNGGNDCYYTLIALLKMLDPELRVNQYCKNYRDLYDPEKFEENFKENLLPEPYLNIFDADHRAIADHKRTKFPPNNEVLGSVKLSQNEVLQRLDNYWDCQ